MIAAALPLAFASLILFDRDGTILAGLFGAKTPSDAWSIYLKAIIVLLSLVATAILAQRFVQLEKIKISVASVESMIKSQTLPAAIASDCLFENLDMGPYVESAQSDIVLIGINLTSLLGTYRERLNAQIARGRRLSVGIIDSDPGNLDAATRRSDIALSEADYYRSKLHTSLLELRQMTATAAKIGNGHNLKLVMLPFVPSFSLRGFDINHQTGLIVLEIYPHRTASSPPMVVLRPQTDPHWFRYFKDQIEVMLRDGKEYNLHGHA